MPVIRSRADHDTRLARRSRRARNPGQIPRGDSRSWSLGGAVGANAVGIHEPRAEGRDRVTLTRAGAALAQEGADSGRALRMPGPPDDKTIVWATAPWRLMWLESYSSLVSVSIVSVPSICRSCTFRNQTRPAVSRRRVCYRLSSRSRTRSAPRAAVCPTRNHHPAGLRNASKASNEMAHAVLGPSYPFMATSRLTKADWPGKANSW